MIANLKNTNDVLYTNEGKRETKKMSKIVRISYSLKA